MEQCKLYSLSTCSHCKACKRFLGECGIEYEFTDVLQQMIAGGETLLGHPLHGLWSDVGTPEAVAALDADPRLARD